MTDHIRGADYHRMTDFGQFSLDPLNSQQALQVIDRRLEGIDHPPAPWPLTQKELDEAAGGIGIVPRRLLTLCAERFDNESGEKNQTLPEDDSVDAFLNDIWDQRFSEKRDSNHPDQTEEILRHGFPLLAQAVAPELEAVRDDQLPDISLAYEGHHGVAGISICNQSNMSSLAACLKRLKTQHAENRLHRLVIVRDPRRPVSPGAKATQKLLEELEQRQAVIFHPTPEMLAALDTLRELLSDAKSGDLSQGGQTVTASTVEAWIAATLPESLRTLTATFLDTTPHAPNENHNAPPEASIFDA